MLIDDFLGAPTCFGARSLNNSMWCHGTRHHMARLPLGTGQVYPYFMVGVDEYEHSELN